MAQFAQYTLQRLEGLTLLPVISLCAGRSHGKATTFPRLADPLGFVKAEDIFHAGALAVAGRVDCYFIERGSITGALGWMTGLAVQSRQRET